MRECEKSGNPNENIDSHPPQRDRLNLPGRVYEIVSFRHRLLVKPAPTNSQILQQITNHQLLITLMLYLAEVQNQEILGEISLQLLACQTSDDTWAILTEESFLTLPKDFAQNPINSATNGLNEGMLVLADIGKNSKVLHIQAATNWVLELVEKYLTTGFTPDFLHQEAQKAEGWRQSLTLQSQELSRRLIEVEARREQIQNLEAKLQQEKQLLESSIAQLKIGPATPQI